MLTLINYNIAASELISIVEVTIPDYTVTTEGGLDYIEIPGGETLLVEEGRPRVPYYIKFIHYSEGYRVQDVIMEEKSGLRTSTGLRLPVVTLDPFRPSDVIKGWYPEKEYEWKIWMNANGSSTLQISIFPFFYNPETTECKYYTYYRFRIIYILSTVSVLDVATDKPVYDIGENVTIDVLISNPGEAKNIVVNTLIRQYSSDEVVDSLPLRTLHNVAGEASFSMTWNSHGFPADFYYVEVMLNDTSGNWLDKRTCEFKLGRSMINVTSFSVEPQHFKIGDQVEASLEALNTGSTTLNGRCVFMVQKDGNSVWQSHHNFSSFAPKASLRFTSIWNTSSAEKGALYHVIGYVSYESQTTPPVVVMVSTNYLPVARFSYTPTKVGLCEEVTFDASASSDPDGSISSYKWEFGDGGKASGVNVKHSYHGLGDYLVTLTVTDNEGAINSTTRLIRVVMAYDLNVSSNVAIEIPGSGKYREGDEVILTAPSSANMPGLLGLLGAKYAFKQWTGFMNSTNNSVKLVFTGYETRLYMRAVYSEDYTMMMVTVGIISVVIITAITLSLYRRRGKKRPPSSQSSPASM
ncbi:MAG: PKD domain-containing protein [Thermoproteota archaeon]